MNISRSKPETSKTAWVFILVFACLLGCEKQTAHKSAQTEFTTTSTRKAPANTAQHASGHAVNTDIAPERKSPTRIHHSSAGPANRPVAVEATLGPTSDDTHRVPATISSRTSPVSTASPASSAAFRQLISAYRLQDPTAWSLAEKELLSLGRAAVPALAEQLRGDVVSRELAIMMLARLGNDALQSAETLQLVLNDNSKLVRANAAAILSLDEKYSAHVMPVLMQLLDGTDIEFNILAATALGNLGASAKPAIPRLTGLLSNPESRLRFAAANTLGLVGPPAKSTVPALTNLLRDADAGVRTVAHEAIERIQPPMTGQ